MSRGEKTPVWERIRELLADGEWHDGRTVLLEAGKLITPGVAQRTTEQLRAQGTGAPEERVRKLSVARQIEAGKKKILSDHIRLKVKAGTIETVPAWPINQPLFDATRPWQMRLLRGVHFFTPPEVAAKLDVSAHVIRTVIDTEGLPYTNIGTSRRVIQIRAEDLPLYEKAVEKWRGNSEARQKARTVVGAETRLQASVRQYLNEVLGPSAEPVFTRIRKVVDELERLRRINTELRSELALAREELRDHASLR